MEFKVVPFTANISQQDNAGLVANQMQSIIDQHAGSGWEYIRMDTVETAVQPDSGCFGIGGKPGFTTHFNVLVFKRTA